MINRRKHILNILWITITFIWFFIILKPGMADDEIGKTIFLYAFATLVFSIIRNFKPFAIEETKNNHKEY